MSYFEIMSIIFLVFVGMMLLDLIAFVIAGGPLGHRSIATGSGFYYLCRYWTQPKYRLTSRSFRRELKRSLEGCRLRPSFALDLFEEGFCLDLFGFLIPLLFLDRLAYPPHEIMESWGFKYVDKSLHLTWGKRYKIIWMPWLCVGVQFEVLRGDGEWVKKAYSYNGDEPDGRKCEAFPYRYTLKNGKLQERTATVHVERTRYVWRCFRKLPIFWPLWNWDYWIDVQFSDEVGERSGSWKGGCIGCSYKMNPGETPEQTLRRMEVERKF